MYQDFFSLQQLPFSIAPDAQFLFFSEQHKEALAHLTYGLQGSGGFGVLTGEVGTGKTSVCQFLLRELPDATDIAIIDNPDITEIDLLISICDQFSIDYGQVEITLKVLFDALAKWMLINHQQGRHAIVIIDEAQQLSFKALELLRLITNIEANNLKPLQIILIGQTELQKKLLTKELRQLSQRITARYHLQTLSAQETSSYIVHRLNQAGAKAPIFESKSVALIAAASGGNPRAINQICDRCLLAAYSQSAYVVSAAIAKKAINESELAAPKKRVAGYIAYLVALSAILVTLFMVSQQNGVDDAQPNALNTEATLADNNTPTATAAKVNEKAIVKSWSLTPNDTLLAIPANHYSLQLTTLANQNLVDNFFSAYPQLQQRSYLYQRVNGQRTRYVILLGNFASYGAAQQASEELLLTFPNIDPWIKEYRTIQYDIQ